MNARHQLEVDGHGQPRRRYVAETPEQMRQCLHHINATAHEYMRRGQPIEIRVRTKSAQSWDQLKRLNAMCGDMAKQADWHGHRLSKDEWRHLLVAVLRQDQRQIPGANGQGFVLLGGSSRELSRKETSDAIEMLYALGSERDVVWTDPTQPPLEVSG